jgi:hypothetical protein
MLTTTEPGSHRPKSRMARGSRMIPYQDQFGVPERYEADVPEGLRLIYGDIQQVLKVPVVNFIFRSTAFYETFLAIGWSQVRPNLLTVTMEQAAQALRYPLLTVETPYFDWSKWYDPNTIERIKKIIYTFNYVNTKLLLIASAWAESLGSRSILGGTPVTGWIQPGIFPNLPAIRMMQVEEAPPEIRNLLLDIARRHQTYDVASDFRALAYYPQFLGESWHHLKPYVGSDEYNRLTAQLKSQSIEWVHHLSFPVTINRALLTHYYSDQAIVGIMGTVSMFQNLLPGLIVDGEFLRRMIHTR